MGSGCEPTSIIEIIINLNRKTLLISGRRKLLQADPTNASPDGSCTHKYDTILANEVRVTNFSVYGIVPERNEWDTSVWSGADNVWEQEKL